MHVENTLGNMKVKNAPEPSDILWENLEFSSISKLKFRYLALMLTLCIIIVSIAMNNFAKSYLSSLPTNSDCRSSEIIGSTPLELAINLYRSENQINCYCIQQSVSDLVNNSDLRNFCKVYLNSLVQNNLIRLAAGICTVIINYLLELIICKLSKYERFSNKTKLRLHILLRLFIMMFINTAITTLLANTNISANIYGILNGKYNDFSREWYNDVGETITVTMLVSIFSSHFLNLVIVYPFAICRKRLCYRKCKTQIELNKLLRGASFDIADSLCEVLTLVFTCFMYSGGIPLLNLICFFGLVLTYWCNKVLIFRYYRKPPMYSADINRRAIKILPFAVVFHCVISSCMFSNPDIFPSAFQRDPTGNYVQALRISITERLQKPASTANIGVISLTFIISGLFFIFIRKYREMKLKKAFDESPSLAADTRPVLNNEDFSNSSYDIMDNLKYQKLIQEVNLAASRKTQVYPHGMKVYSYSDSEDNSSKLAMQSAKEELSMEEEKISESERHSLICTGLYKDSRVLSMKSCPK